MSTGNNINLCIFTYKYTFVFHRVPLFLLHEKRSMKV